MILNAIQWTSGQTYANCVTFNEVKDLLAAAVRQRWRDRCRQHRAERAARQRRRRASCRQRRGRGHGFAKQFVAQTKRVANCGCADGGKALLELQSKGVELVGWMTGNEVAPPAPKFVQDHDRAAVGGTVPATLVADAGRARDVRRVHAGRGQGLHGHDHGHRDLDRR